MSDSGRLLLGVIEFQEAKRLQSLLEDLGVPLELISNSETCSTGGCKVTVEAYFPEAQLAVVQEFLKAEHDRRHDGLEVDASLLSEVFDSEKATARCPACGTEFSTQCKECPDCGLVFVTETDLS